MGVTLNRSKSMCANPHVSGAMVVASDACSLTGNLDNMRRVTARVSGFQLNMASIYNKIATI